MNTILALSYPSSNNQLETSSNPMHQVAMPERQTLSYVDNTSKSNDDMARKKQGFMTTNALFQADGVEVYDSDCDDVPNAQPSFMANISSYGSDALAEVHNPDNVDNNMINQAVQAMPSSEQSNVVNHSETEITSDSNIIPYSQYVIESQQAVVQNSNSSAQQDALILSVIEQLKSQVINCTKINLDNKSVNDSLTAELERYKEQVKVLKEGQNVDLKSKDNVSDSFTLLKNDFKKEESRNIDREIALEKKIKQLDNIVFKRDQSAQTVHMLTKPQFFYDHTTKQALGFQNPFYLKKAQQLEPKLYDGNVIKNTSAIVIPDSEETLMKRVNSMNSSDPNPSCRPTKVEVPKELPKVSMVNTSLKKLKHHLVGFDVVVNQKSVEIFDLNASLQEKVLVITALKNELRKLKRKSVYACRESRNKPKVIAPIVHKEDLEPLSPKLKNNREAHIDYIRITKENADTLRDIVEQARTLNPLDNALAYACMYTKQIQELLVYVSDTCPSSPVKSEKLVAVTPMNKARKVTFVKTSTTSDNNTQIQVDVHQTQTTSKPLEPSTNEK
ncbi:hypothetical protein Tco_0992761 [Tanacetum coccineum]|uniref:Uncharacterized protein n=1 Tax=Tanacetum coccineum TaxID=301880 RepID=A0ABQ5F3A2_9ASTR